MLFAGALAGSASAQSSDQIIFSKPVDDDIKSPNAGVDSTPNADIVAPPHGASSSFFDSSADLPMLPPTFNPNPQRPANRGSWVFMTPEQIMGVQTPEQMLGLMDKNGDGSLTPEQQFIKRQQNTKLSMATNGASSLNLWSGDANPFSHRTQNSAFSKPGGPADPNSPGAPNGDSPKDFSRFISAPGHSIFGENQKFNDQMAGAFASPASNLPKVDLKQMAEMERFRTLIGGSSSQPNSSIASFQTSNPKPQPGSQDIFGRPLATSSSELKQPASLTTLPTVTGAYAAPTTAPKKTWWQPRPAPWLSTGLQPDSLNAAPPVRKFY